MTLATKEEIIANYEKFCGKCVKNCVHKSSAELGRDTRSLWLSNNGQVYCRKFKSKPKTKPESSGLFEMIEEL